MAKLKHTREKVPAASPARGEQGQAPPPPSLGPPNPVPQPSSSPGQDGGDQKGQTLCVPPNRVGG